MHMVLAPEQRQTFSRRLPLRIAFERLVCMAISSNRSNTNMQSCGFLFHHGRNSASSCKTHEQRRGKKQYPETTIMIECLDTKYINKKQTNVNLRTATKHETQGKAGGQGIPFTWPFVTSIGQGQPTSVTSPDAPAPISVQSWLP